MTWTEMSEVNSGDVYLKGRFNLQVKGNLEHLRDLPRLRLSLLSAVFPMSGVTPAALSQLESSAASPKPNWLAAAFDSATDEGLMWNEVLERGFGVSPVLRVYYYMASAVAGNVVWAAQIAALSDQDAILAKGFDTANSVVDAVPDTAGKITYADIPLTNIDSMVAGDFVTIILTRDANHASDNASGDAKMIYAELLYSVG